MNKYYPGEPVNIHIQEWINIIQESNRVITIKKGKVNLQLFCGNGKWLIPIYCVYHLYYLLHFLDQAHSTKSFRFGYLLSIPFNFWLYGWTALSNHYLIHIVFNFLALCNLCQCIYPVLSPTFSVWGVSYPSLLLNIQAFDLPIKPWPGCPYQSIFTKFLLHVWNASKYNYWIHHKTSPR